MLGLSSDGKDSSIISTATSILQVQSSRQSIIRNETNEFDDYLSKMPPEMIRRSLKHSVGVNRITSVKQELIKRCHQTIPKEFFSPDFKIGTSLLDRSLKVSKQKQASIGEHLDDIEVCLFNQLTSRFDQILSVLRSVTSLECLVNDNLRNLSVVRRTNFQRTQTVVNKHEKIISLHRRANNLARLLSCMAKMRIYVHINDPEVIQNAESVENFRNDVEFYVQLRCTTSINDKLEECESYLRHSFSETVNSPFSNYLIAATRHDPRFWVDLRQRATTVSNTNTDQDSTMMLDESVIHEVNRLVEPMKVDIAFQTKIMKALEGWRSGDYAVGELKSKIDKHLKSIHAKFITDLRDFCTDVLQRDGVKVQNPNQANLLKQFSIMTCCRIYKEYAETFRGLVLRLLQVNRLCIRFILKESYEEQSMEGKQKLSLMLEGLVNVCVFIFKGVYDRLLQLVNLKVISESVDLTEFKLLIAVYENEEEFLAKLARPLLEFPEAAKSFLAQKINKFQNKLNLSLVEEDKNACIFDFIDRMHKMVIEKELKQSLEQEVWQAIDVPTAYYDSLHYLITGEMLSTRKHKSTLRTQNLSAIYETSMLMDSMMIMEKEIKAFPQKALQSDFRIIRTDVIVKGKVYKIHKTLLLIIEVLEDYLLLAHTYPAVKDRVSQKISELLRFYNASSTQLIIHGGAVELKKIKTNNITAKHVALSTLCLQFIMYLMESINSRTQIPDEAKLRMDYQSHIDAGIEKLETILKKKVSQALSDIKLEYTPSKGTQSIVTNSKTLFNILIDFYDKPTQARVFTKDIFKLYLNKLQTLKAQSKIEAEALKDDINFIFSELKLFEELIPQFSQLQQEGEDIIRRAFEAL